MPKLDYLFFDTPCITTSFLFLLTINYLFLLLLTNDVIPIITAII